MFDTVVAEGLTPAIRETVAAIGEDEEVSLAELAARLHVAKSTASYRVGRSIAAGWLVNRETRQRQPGRYTRGLPLPDETTALPDARALFDCSNGSRGDGPYVPPSPIADGDGVRV